MNSVDSYYFVALGRVCVCVCVCVCASSLLICWSGIIYLVNLDKGLLILLIFSRNQLFVSLNLLFLLY
jgi:hypothetical protein